LRYNDVILTRRIKISNSTATPTIENEQVPSQEELARILRASPPRIKVARCDYVPDFATFFTQSLTPFL
jgi:hypothetical protein